MNSVRSFSCKFGGDGCSQHRDTVRGDHLRERVSNVLTKMNQGYFAKLLSVPFRDAL